MIQRKQKSLIYTYINYKNNLFQTIVYNLLYLCRHNIHRMIYPKNFEQKTGFDKIRQQLYDSCLSPMGHDHVKTMTFQASYDVIEQRLDQTNQFLNLLHFESAFPSNDYLDMRNTLKKLTTEGTIIETEDLHNLNTSLKVMEEIRLFLNNLDPEKYDKLQILTQSVESWKTFIEPADKIIDTKGEIRPDASNTLLEITKKIKSFERSLYSKIQQTLNQAKKSDWIAEEGEITVRNGRLVIPVKASQKRKIKGFVHDESSSGQTIYIEPEHAYETNNEIRKLRSDYKQEIKRIIGEYTKEIRPYIPDLVQDYEWLGFIDFLRSKALLASRLHAEKPKLFNEQRIHWQAAVHPLLYQAHKEQNKNVVPLDISLNQEQRILIISGPNAGGKSVCLKTTGLLQYMLQCGLMIPVKASSECGIFNQIFIDIGDEQSLENDLSTYSSHLNNLRVFTENSNSATLTLIDEMGTGTEPQMGGAIAEASLEVLYERGTYAVVTTHYANLKLLADKYPAIENGAMLFDSKNIKPLFQLKIGKPGHSFAFEIAKNTGLPDEIIKRAKEKTGKTHLDFEKQLQSLEQDKSQVDKKEYELKVADDLLAETIDKYNRLNADLEKNRKEIIEKAKAEAREILNNSNRLIENTIREIKESEADKAKTKESRATFDKEKEKILKPKEKTAKSKPKKQKAPASHPPKQNINKAPEKDYELVKGEIHSGDTVKIIGQSGSGEVISISKNKAEVSFGQMKMQIPVAKLEKIKTTKKQEKKTQGNYHNIMEDMQQKSQNFSSTLDIRGVKADEALTKLMNFIDDATLLGVYDLRILHGKGHGVLRSVVRDYLAGLDEVKNFHDEHVERGGQGITIVKLK